MMRILAMAAVLAGVSCSHPTAFVPEGYAHHYEPLATETDHRRIDRRDILHWTRDPSKKERLGFLYKYETRLEGSRTWRLSYHIMDLTGTKRVGFITQEGTVYRYDENGRFSNRQRIGEYGIQETGWPDPICLKRFYSIPISENVDLEEIDPYRR